MSRKKKFQSRSRSKKHQERERKNKPTQESSGGASPSPRRHGNRGRIQKNPKGFAFILSDDPMTPDTYVSREEARGLMDGDIVRYKTHRHGPKSFAEILEIEVRGQKEVLGVFRRNGPHAFLETVEGEQHLIEEPKPETRPGDWILAKILEYPTERRLARVEIDKNLGKDLQPKHDIMIATSRFGIPTSFPNNVIENAQDVRTPGLEELKKPSKSRRDLKPVPFVTVDGEDAKDFDDAICVLENKDGSPFVLYVAIADVSFFVKPGSALDHEAKKRGTSVYFPGTCIPMLPEELSNDLCSLRGQEEKLTLTAELHYDAQGTVVKTFFYESIICTKRRMTYTELQAYFDGNKEAQTTLAFLKQPLDSAKKLFELLLKKRAARGVLEFQLPESKILVDAEGKPIEVKRYPQWDAHKLIEEFMVAANSAVAKKIKESHHQTLYRVHEEPDALKLDEMNQLLRALGFHEKVHSLIPQEISRILKVTTGVKGSKTLHQAMLRMMRQARYEPTPKGHFGLALKDYCHFTSPIRRYPDLLVHRALKEVILSSANAEKIKDTSSLESLGEQTSLCERRSMEAERFVVKRKACWFMKERLGEVYDGEISSITSRGVFIEILEFGIDGFCPLENLRGFWQYDEARLCLRQRPGHSVLNLGDPLKIRVARVDLLDNEIEFSME